MANVLVSTGDTVEEIAGSAIQPGAFAFEGVLAKFYTGAAEIAAGSNAAPLVNGVVQILKDTKANTYAVGATVWGDETAQTALNSASGADGVLGVANKASAATDDYVEVRLIAGYHPIYTP